MQPPVHTGLFSGIRDFSGSGRGQNSQSLLCTQMYSNVKLKLKLGLSSPSLSNKVDIFQSKNVFVLNSFFVFPCLVSERKGTKRGNSELIPTTYYLLIWKSQ